MGQTQYIGPEYLSGKYSWANMGYMNELQKPPDVAPRTEMPTLKDLGSKLKPQRRDRGFSWFL